MEHSLLRSENVAVFYRTRIFITVFKTVPLVPSPNQVNSVFVLSFLYVRATLLSSHLRLHFPYLFFPSGFRLKFWEHFILLDVFTQIVFDEFKSRCCSQCIFLSRLIVPASRAHTNFSASTDIFTR